MGVVSSLDTTSSLRGRKVSPDVDPKGKKSIIMRQSFLGIIPPSQVASYTSG